MPAAACLEAAVRLPHNSFRGIPVDAFVSYGDPVSKLREVIGNRLIAGIEETLDHDTGNGAVSSRDLVDNAIKDKRLFFVVFL